MTGVGGADGNPDLGILLPQKLVGTDVVAMPVRADNPFRTQVVFAQPRGDALTIATGIDNQGAGAVGTEDVAVGFEFGDDKFVEEHFKDSEVRIQKQLLTPQASSLTPSCRGNR